MKAMILEKHCNNLIVWAIINLKGYNSHFCPIYLPPSEPISDKIETLTQDKYIETKIPYHRW